MKSLFLSGLAGLLAAATGGAAVVRGTVVENQTGKLLARASVTLQRVGSGGGSTLSARTSISGTFEFGGLAGGAYLLKVARRGFMPLEHGQKNWNSAGRPLFLDEAASVFLSLRMFRYGAVSGSVLDENDVGLPDHDVIAYRNTEPPQIAARSKSNDRGAYRILGLEPGTYFVRTAAALSEDGYYIPTFARETLTVDNARPVQLEVEQQAGNVDVRPLKGRLVTISGTVTAEMPNVPDPPVVPVTVTLATDTGRQSVTTAGPFQFPAILPGPFEIYAEGPADDNPIVSFQGAHILASARGDTVQGLRLSSMGNVRFLFRGAPARALETGSMRLLARRNDLAGYGPVVRLMPGRDRLALRPGVWEVMLLPPRGYYVSGFSGTRISRSWRPRPDVQSSAIARPRPESIVSVRATHLSSTPTSVM